MQNQIISYSLPQQGADLEFQTQPLTPQQKTYQNTYQQLPSTQLQQIIMQKLNSLQKQPDQISKELEVKLDRLLEKIIFGKDFNDEEHLRLRMHQLALSKILVHTHGKSQFYQVKAHHHLGQAYLNYKCYEQALDHLTLALKKNAKINDMNQIKLYHSYVLTTYSRCYYQISSYQDALQILKKAHDIQLGCEDENNKIDNIETLGLISNCYLKLKQHGNSLQFIEKTLSLLQIKKSKQSKQYIKTKIQKSRILFCDNQRTNQAINQLQNAIQTLITIKYENVIQIGDYYELLSSYYEKVNDHQKQIQNLRNKLEIYSQKYENAHEKTLKVKKTIAYLLMKYTKINEAIHQFQQILELQQKYHEQNKTAIGKTLKALGFCNLVFQNKLNQAENYLKRAQKMLTSDNSSLKAVKQIKSKLLQIKQRRQLKDGIKKQSAIQKQLQNQPIGIAH